MATAGIALGIVGLIVGVAWLVVFAAFIKDVNNKLRIQPGDFAVDQQRCATATRSQFTATGEITNTTDEQKLFVTVHVEARDSRGRVVGQADDFIGDVRADETEAYAVRGVVEGDNVESVTCIVTVD
jgi:hypothetical protein